MVEYKIFVFMIGIELMAVVIHVHTILEKQTLEANNWRKIESQLLYSTAGDGTIWETEEAVNYFFST